ncbi:PEP-CTERM sorting domain-containing protein [Elioraea sp.]|uniref:PEP-CTERM sorting domain-containing protein n=1 Tax=Elioraea sp. TaxID=2185103 RepID=UPI0025C5A2F9|nr:PEP-CTERM sorting domain-containing protein [Elioraea sp.]
MVALDNDVAPPKAIIGPTRAGFMQFDLADYCNGIDFSLTKFSARPSWESLGVDQLLVSFGDVNITLADLDKLFPQTLLVDWSFSLTIPDLPNPEDLKNPNVFPTAFQLRLLTVSSELTFGLAGGGGNALSGEYASEGTLGCYVGPVTETACSVSGTLAGPFYVPEPATIGLFGAGLVFLAGTLRRRGGVTTA